MEIWVIAAVIGWILRDPAGTIQAAAEYRKAAPSNRAPKAARRGMRGYLWTVWDTRWEEAAKRYPERMRAAQARRAKRHARRKAAWEKTKEAAGARWDRRQADRGTSKATEGVPATGDFEKGAEVIDLDERRKPRGEDAVEEGKEAVPEENEENVEADKNRQEQTKDLKEDDVAINLSDAGTLAAHLAGLRATAGYMTSLATDMERLAAGMRAHDMGASAVGAVDAACAADTEAAAALARAAAELEAANAGVAEAYASHRDAADGHYQTNGR
ncbi:hypothetical protein ACQEU5_07135 [Marinactinospora thermotolerans]|uniref:hypothetical protein n=1 Tax=Marinactinospora thermotolerans TaxID=531310 RepID=UPI003D918FAD